MFPPRKPVAGGGGAANQAQAPVSLPDLAYHVRRAADGGSSAQHPPQRMDTVTSSGGKFTVSPASSIHDNDDSSGGEDGYGLHGSGRGSGAAGKETGFTPSPTRYRSAAQAQAQAQAQARGGWFGGDGAPARGTAAAAGRQSDPKALALWQTRPDPDHMPLPLPAAAHSRGSRDLQELADARVRSAQAGLTPGRTSYGPAPVLASVPEPGPEPEPEPEPPAAVVMAGNEVALTPSASWQGRREERTAGQQDRQRIQAQDARSDSAGPFMHYEDIDYFGPVAESEPKDELQVDGGAPRADTFPDIDEGMNRPGARRSWDRQRKRRRKMGPGPAGPGEEGRRRGGGGSSDWRSCMDWLPEILCCLLGITCFAIIVAVLRTFEGRGLTDWPLTVSLNTLVAFLVAICYAALAVPLTEGLSQLKWNSFARGEKPLADFQTFEDAKRSPVGGAILLYKRKGRGLGMTAATALLTGFLLSPLTQGAITYRTRSLEAGGGTASVARSESYSHPAPYEMLDTREKQAIQSGIYHAVDEEVPQLQPICSSGDCQWGNFSSLAICAAVADVSDRLTVSSQTRPRDAGVSLGVANGETVRSARLVNGLFLVGSTTTCNLNVSWPRIPVHTEDKTGDENQESFLPARTSLAFSEQDGRVSNAIANFFLVYTNQTAAVGSKPQQDVFRAAEVLLHFCVNTYQVSTSRGVSASKVVHSSTLSAQQDSSNKVVDGRGVSSSSQQSPGVLLRSTAGPGVYSVKRDDVRLLNSYVLSLFSGTYSYQYGSRIGGETATSEALGTAMFRGGLSSEDDIRDAVRNLTSNVATSLTKTIRARSSTSETGIVLSTESYVHIRWAWLSFLAIQLVLSVSFLLGIMIQTAVWNVEVLKGSPAAALLAISADDKAYLEEREHTRLDNSRGEHANDRARKLRAITCRFVGGDRGWTLDLSKREDG